MKPEDQQYFGKLLKVQLGWAAASRRAVALMTWCWRAAPRSSPTLARLDSSRPSRPLVTLAFTCCSPPLCVIRCTASPVPQDVDESELTVEEAKERKIMKLLLKVKNGTPPQRKSALRQLTGAARWPAGCMWPLMRCAGVVMFCAYAVFRPCKTSVSPNCGWQPLQHALSK
jgi:hypothetical protein